MQPLAFVLTTGEKSPLSRRSAPARSGAIAALTSGNAGAAGWIFAPDACTAPAMAARQSEVEAHESRLEFIDHVGRGSVERRATGTCGSHALSEAERLN